VLIGVLSDTHQPNDRQTIWDELHTAFKGVDLILHGGDIHAPRILDALEEIAPVIAARGNHDVGWNDRRIKEIQFVDAEGLRIGITHAIEPENRPIDVLRRMYYKDVPIDIMVSGDSHIERLDYRDGVLQMNPGSPTLSHHWSTRLGTVGLIDIGPDRRVEARIVRIGETEGKKNPGVEFSFTPETGVVRLG